MQRTQKGIFSKFFWVFVFMFLLVMVTIFPTVAYAESTKTIEINELATYTDNQGFRAVIINEIDDNNFSNLNAKILKIGSFEEYNRILISITGTQEVDNIDVPQALAFINIGKSKMVYKITSDRELTDEEIFEETREAYYDNILMQTAENDAITSFMSSSKALPGHGYTGYGFSFDSEWKTYGQWTTTKYTYNDKPTLFGNQTDLCHVYEQIMTLYCKGQYGEEYYCQLQILNIVWAESSMQGVSLTYNNTKANDNIYPCTYDEYAPKASVNNSNASVGVNYGINSSGAINFGVTQSMSQVKSDCNVSDNSNKFDGKISLFYEFGGTYSKSTMYLNSFVVAKKASNNYSDNVSMSRNVVMTIKSNAALGYTYNNWNVFSKTNILFRPNII